MRNGPTKSFRISEGLELNRGGGPCARGRPRGQSWYAPEFQLNRFKIPEGEAGGREGSEVRNRNAC